jgi:glutathione S-transferase
MGAEILALLPSQRPRAVLWTDPVLQAVLRPGAPRFRPHASFSLLTRVQPVAPNVIERFEKEAKRVTGVIDAHLKKTGTKYLVGDTVTYADISFIPWYKIFTFMPIEGWKPEEELPHYGAWIKALNERPAVQKVYAMEAFQRS